MKWKYTCLYVVVAVVSSPTSTQRFGIVNNMANCALRMYLFYYFRGTGAAPELSRHGRPWSSIGRQLLPITRPWYFQRFRALLMTSHLGHIRDHWHSQAFTVAHIVIDLSLHIHSFNSSKVPPTGGYLVWLQISSYRHFSAIFWLCCD